MYSDYLHLPSFVPYVVIKQFTISCICSIKNCGRTLEFFILFIYFLSLFIYLFYFYLFIFFSDIL